VLILNRVFGSSTLMSVYSRWQLTIRLGDQIRHRTPTSRGKKSQGRYEAVGPIRVASSELDIPGWMPNHPLTSERIGLSPVTPFMNKADALKVAVCMLC